MYQSPELELVSKLKVLGSIRHLHYFSIPFQSVLKEMCGYMNQLLGLERATFEQMTGRMLAEHYRDRKKMKKNCEKEVVRPHLGGRK
jgi:hypothetical protein